MSELRGTALALALLGVLAFGWSRLATDADPRGPAGPVPLLALDPGALLELRVERDTDGYVLRRAADGGFALAVPGSVETTWATDPSAVDTFLDAFCRLRADHVVGALAPGEDPGLQAPAARLAFRTRTGSGALRVGAPNRVGGSGYAALEGDPRVFAVAQAHLAPLLVRPQELRERSLLRVPFERLQTLAVKRREGSLAFRRVGPGLFEAQGQDGGTTLPVFPPRLRQLCDELTALKVEAFAEPRPGEPDRFGLAAPGLRVEATFQPPLGPVALDVGGRAPDAPLVAWVRRAGSPTICGVGADTLQFLSATPDEFRDRSPFSLPGEGPTELRVRDLGVSRRRAIAARTLKGWAFLAGDGRATDAPAAAFWDDLGRLRALAYRRLPDQNLAPLGLDRPRWRVELQAYRDPVATFLVGAAASGRVYVLLPDQAVAEVDARLVDLLAGVVRDHGHPVPGEE